MPSAVFIRQTLESLTSITISVKILWQLEESKTQDLNTYRPVIYSWCCRWQTKRNQRNKKTQYISHLVHLQNTVEILMLHFHVLKCFHMVSEHYWTLPASHIIAILQLDKAGMLNNLGKLPKNSKQFWNLSVFFRSPQGFRSLWKDHVKPTIKGKIQDLQGTSTVGLALCFLYASRSQCMPERMPDF